MIMCAGSGAPAALAAAAACDSITTHVVSTHAELDRLVKTVEPESYRLQSLLALAGGLAQLREAVETLRDALRHAGLASAPVPVPAPVPAPVPTLAPAPGSETSTHPPPSPSVQSALKVALPPCHDASAVIGKQVQRLGGGFDVETLNVELVDEFARCHAANMRLFTVLAAVVHISPTAQEERFVALQGRTLLDQAVEASARVLGMGDILLADARSPSPSSREQPPPEYSSASDSKGKQKATDGFFSSLSHSFKAMTASLRPKPEPMVITMCESAKDGNVAHLKGFVAQGVNMNGQNEDGYTALICATRANQAAAVRYLLLAGAQLNFRDSHSGQRKPALFHAAECGHVAMAELLIDAGAGIRDSSTWTGQPFFVEVASSASLDMLKLFLDHGADPNTTSINGRSVFIQALQAGSLDHLRLLRQYGGNVNARDITGQPALHLALSQNRLDIVDFLLQNGADVNASNLTGNSLLHVAVGKRNLALAKLLLERGANPNASDYVGRSLLGKLVEGAKLTDTFESELATAVLAKGADPNQYDSWGERLLCHVLEKGNTSLLRAFLERGADPNHMFRRQDTPLLYALSQGMLGNARLLLKHGADPNKANAEGKTPLVEALVMGETELVRELLGKGADINKAGAAKPAALVAVLADPEIVQMLVARGAVAPAKAPAGPRRASGQGSPSTAAPSAVAAPAVASSGNTGGEELPAYSPEQR
ncbi:hypothetical protein VD0002_g6217 [Verticillium dahliae]|nr:ankyrin repeat and SAM domain-containing protein [Verticillium dahliae]PNH30048.1 hypothetical protein BJF96_g6740 [Verticillium dahliae]PNH39036.1 hypothetical protein VD0004_g7823 [Verticillium dahliae]PNH50963.1 hypothetical protein VD0003_g6249 [Verticillium dahliae]PNH61641.1 hypothetical protein VD0002_g6217 [Verticillium dahliae]